MADSTHCARRAIAGSSDTKSAAKRLSKPCPIKAAREMAVLPELAAASGRDQMQNDSAEADVMSRRERQPFDRP